MSENKKTKQGNNTPKNLTMAKVKREAKSTNKMEEYELNDEDIIKFYPVFPYSKIVELAKELGSDMAEAEEQEIEIDDELFMTYAYFLCIKYFTSLEKGFSDKFADKLSQMEYMIDAGYYQQIIDEVFLPKELGKTIDRISDEISKTRLLDDFAKRTDRKLEELKFKNRDVLESLEDISEDNQVNKQSH